MFIERLQIEEGFLDGFDVRLTPGLNVVIGARGTGKTSFIELIRYCLDSTGNTTESSRRSRDHALSILGSGQVTVTLVIDGQRVTVTRTASDALPRSTGPYLKPIIFSQTEIETVGLEAAGRLRLIDSFAGYESASGSAEERQEIAKIASATAEVMKMRRDLEELEKTFTDLKVVEVELAQSAQMEATVANTSQILQPKIAQLQQLSEVLSVIATEREVFQRLQVHIGSWNTSIKVAYDAAGPEVDPNFGTLEIRQKIALTRELLRQSQQNTYEIWHDLDQSINALEKRRVDLESSTRSIRQEVEAVQAGAGQVMRKGQELREKKARLDAIAGLLSVQKTALDESLKSRGIAFNRLDQLREVRFQARKDIVRKLNESLQPTIRVTITRNGQNANFTSAVSELLRGSGLKYADLATSIANTITPRSLQDAVEQFDVDFLRKAANIQPDRAAKVLSHLRNIDLTPLSTLDIEDEVGLQLLDGTDYKDLSSLSTGQRCAVILPLVLAHTDSVIVVDQPEDHIDNAFITSTLIKSILKRDVDGQILFTTHNPNIPVLGDADNVIHLGSDGKRGFVLASGALHEPRIVGAISSVMEGGAAAFVKRSNFYSFLDMA